jgi:hypothetical protein
MNCPKCGNPTPRLIHVRNEVGRYQGVISCLMCGSDRYFDLPQAQPPRQGRGKVVKLPGARKRRAEGYHAHDRKISGIDGRGTR